MLSIAGNARLFLCNIPVNIGKSFEGLSTLVEQMFPGELLSGAYFIFLNRRRNHMKVLWWDTDGFVIMYKRLERGSFLQDKSGNTQLDRRTFLMLLEGVVPKRLQRRFFL